MSIVAHHAPEVQLFSLAAYDKRKFSLALRFSGAGPHYIYVEPTLDQPFDKGFKSLAEDEALLVLNKFAKIPESAIAGIEHLPREITSRAPEIDHAYRLALNGETAVIHLEAWAKWQSFIPARTLEYGGTLFRKYGVEVRSFIVLMREEDAPATIPTLAEQQCGRFREEYGYEVIKLWELPAAEVMGPGCERLLAWVPFMKHTEEELRECARRVVESGDEKLQAEFVINGGMRYDRNWLRRLLESFKPMITMDVYANSSVTRERYLQAVRLGKAEGQAEGKSAGLVEGKLDGVRSSLRGFLAARFPGLETSPEIDSIRDPDELSRVALRVFAANTPDEVRAALVSPAQ